MDKFCSDCKHWCTVGEEIVGCWCTLYIPKKSPIRGDDVERFFDPKTDNLNNDCPGWSPNLLKRITIFIGGK